MTEPANLSNIDKVLTILETISDHSDGISLSELAKITLIPKTTVFRILESLKAREYVLYDMLNESYSLDIKSLELGIKGLMNVNLVEVSIPYLKTLSSKTNETCFLGVYNQGHVIYLYKNEGTMSIQTNARLGSRIPAYCTGIGKALLAYQPLEEIERVLSQKLEKITEKTVFDRVQLYNILADIRLNGYAFDNEENEEGLTCIAKPVFNYTNSIVGAISVAGPTHRMSHKIDSVIFELQNICNTISRRLGYIGTK
ncbi:IclR family transcriptional regulator [Orbus sturtevantii]|uniref:IclR family transcriptional regulator n=1 Tax=Orbus sturtevantii TaxID=3074109 RepID=UPI00370D724D